MAPQKTVTSPAPRQVEQVQVVREHAVAADVGQHGEGGGGDERGADGQAVQAVGQVHRVAREGTSSTANRM